LKKSPHNKNRKAGKPKEFLKAKMRYRKSQKGKG
jgi:hypothetical protein